MRDIDNIHHKIDNLFAKKPILIIIFGINSMVLNFLHTIEALLFTLSVFYSK